MYVSRTVPDSDFLLFQLEWNPLCLLFVPTSSLNAQMPRMNYLTALKERMRLFWPLRNGTGISYAKFIRCYLDLSLWRGSYKNPRGNQVDVGSVSGVRLCHKHKVRANTNEFFFEKKDGPIKAQYVPFYVRLRRFEPGLGPNLIYANRPRPAPTSASVSTG